MNSCTQLFFFLLYCLMQLDNWHKNVKVHYYGKSVLKGVMSVVSSFERNHGLSNE